MQDEYFNEKTLNEIRTKLKEDLTPQRRQWLEDDERQCIGMMQRAADPEIAKRVKAWRAAEAIQERKRCELQDIEFAKEKRINAISGSLFITLLGSLGFFINETIGLMGLGLGAGLLFLNILPDKITKPRDENDCQD